MRDRARRAGAGRRRRRVRLPRRARPAGAGAGCSDAGLEWAYRLAAGAAPPVAALPALQPALRGRASRASTRATGSRRRAAASLRAMTHDVSVIGLGRVGLPLALSLRRPRPATCSASTSDPERLDAVARGRDAVRGAGHAGAARARARRAAASTLVRRASPTPPRADHIVLTLGTPSLLAHRDRHVATSARCSTTCCRVLRDGPLARPALDGRAGHDRVRRRLPRASSAASRSARTCSSRTCPSGSPPSRFLEEIGTLPCIVGGVGEALGRARPRELFEVFGAPIVQTTPVQAELAKIWTNILRYATFALPNLLMMDCEQYGANVFEVIDLINRDYPRGGIAAAGPHRRHLPAQGLRVLRGALERARACCWPSRACNESVPLFLVEGLKRRLGSLRGRKVAVLGLAFKRDTDDERDSLVAQADPPARARAGRRRRPRPARRRRRPQSLRGRASPAPTPSSSPPTTPSSATRRRCAAIAERAARGLPGRRPVELLRRRRRSSPTPTEVAALAARDEPRPRHRRRRHDRRGRRAPPARATRPTRCASPTSARRPHWMREGCEVHTGDLRDLDEARAAIARLRARHPPRRDRRRHRQLPQAPAHADRGQQRALQRASSARRSSSDVERFVYVSSSMVFERADRVPDDRGAPRATARRRARPTASRSSPARSTAAPRTTSTGCRTRSAARSTPTARARCPTTSRASPTPSPT